MQALLGLRRRLCAATAGCCPRALPRQLPTVVPLTLLCRPFYVTSADVSTATEANPNGTIEYDRHSFNAIIGKADIVDYYLPVWETCATEANAVRHTTCTPPPPPPPPQKEPGGAPPSTGKRQYGSAPCLSSEPEITTRVSPPRGPVDGQTAATCAGAQ